MGAEGTATLSRRMLGEAGQHSAAKRTHDCARPVRLVGSTRHRDRTTGEERVVYSSAQELDGTTWVPCGNRRAAVCEPCSDRYKADAWQLINAGLTGGKGIPPAVATRPCTFATLTAPSFGPVHGLRDKGPCRARRDKPMCPHGRALWCGKRHGLHDRELGDPLCLDCYDYTAHVVWQWYAPELWRRFTIALQRDLAQRVQLSVADFRRECRISYSKVVEFQARGVIHVHVPIRLDGPEGPDGPRAALALSTTDLEAAIVVAAKRVRVDAAPLTDGRIFRLGWGNQIDTRSISHGDGATGAVHPEQVSSYLAKYLTKATEEFGLSGRVLTAAHAIALGASAHAVRIIETAVELAGMHEDYSMLLTHLGTLGYRGHPITKSRSYSVTFGQLRRARRGFRRNPAGLDPDADIRLIVDDTEDVPEGFELISSWEFAGQGYLDLEQAAAAVMSAAMARTRAPRPIPLTPNPLERTTDEEASR